jgi:hypothetical protein
VCVAVHVHVSLCLFPSVSPPMSLLCHFLFVSSIRLSFSVSLPLCLSPVSHSMPLPLLLCMNYV